MRNEHTSPTLKISKYARYVDPKQLPEKRLPETQLPETQLPEKRLPDEQLPDKQLPDEERDVNFGNFTLSDEIQEVILDPFFSPLMASDLSMMSPVMIVTAEHDILRDEGFLFVERLAREGVDVVHVHASDGFHGFMSFPQAFKIARKTVEQFVKYAKDKFEMCA